MSIMKISNLPRLYVQEQLYEQATINLNNQQSHYILHVMRRKISDELRVFNGYQGEWLAILENINKKNILLRVLTQLKVQPPKLKQINLIFAPIKGPRMNLLMEKSTELGVTNFIPVLFDHSVIDKINMVKMQSTLIEAAEQSEGLNIPNIANLKKFTHVIDNWPHNHHMIFCNEKETNNRIIDYLTDNKNNESYNILIGPEGGFSTSEQGILTKLPFIKSVSLGERILRVETACITAISCVQLISELGA